MFRKFLSNSNKPSKPVSYEDASDLAQNGNEEQRADLAGREDIAPEVLYFLAEDKSARVRRVIAANRATPRHADLLLAKDADEDVRGTLAEKVARLSRGMSDQETDRLQVMTYDALTLLAKDQAVRIRQTLSEALHEHADVPADVIKRLAWDVEAAVATPVLTFSPLLTDEDLIEIIHAKPSPGSVSAVSQREGVSGDVSDAIVDSDDSEAIALLLGNHSAQIREETLTRVIEQAENIDLWHMPLAMRPKLPSKAAVKIARFVADDVLKRMAERADLSVACFAAVRDVVLKRLGDGEAIMPERDDAPENRPASMHPDDDQIFDLAARKWADGDLDEDELLRAINAGETKFAMAGIAVMADLPLRTIRRTIETKSAKGCVALAWRARLTPNTAVLIQAKLAHLAWGDVLRPDGGDFPLLDDEMEWQIEFIQGL